MLSGQDAGWIRELFSPALIDWLVEEAPEGLYFELNEGWLCVLLAGDARRRRSGGELLRGRRRPDEADP